MNKLVLQGLHIQVVQPKRKKSESSPKKVSKLVKAKVIEDEEGYKAIINMQNDPDYPDLLVLPFTEASYELKDRKDVFTRAKDEKGRRTRYICSPEKARFMPRSPEFYTPFTTNWIITGHIVSGGSLGKMEFDFKDLITIDGYETNVPHPKLDEIDKMAVKK